MYKLNNADFCKNTEALRGKWKKKNVIKEKQINKYIEDKFHMCVKKKKRSLETLSWQTFFHQIAIHKYNRDNNLDQT